MYVAYKLVPEYEKGEQLLKGYAVTKRCWRKSQPKKEKCPGKILFPYKKILHIYIYTYIHTYINTIAKVLTCA